MWNIILRITANVIKSKAISYIKPVYSTLRIGKTIKSLLKNKFKLKYLKKETRDKLLEDLKRQKEALLKGSFEDKVKEFASESFLTKLFEYFDKNFDPNASKYSKMMSNPDLIWNAPLLKKMNLLKKIWKNILREKYKQIIKIEKMEQQLMERERRRDLREQLFASKFNSRINDKIKAKTQRTYQTFFDKSVREYKQLQEKITKKKLKEQLKQEALEREEFQKRIRELRKNSLLLKKMIVSLAKEENNINLINPEEDIKNFNDFIESLDPEERKMFQSLINKSQELQVEFESSWIDYAYFVPNFRGRIYGQDIDERMEGKIVNSNTRGFMFIKVKRPSKVNPEGKYSWWNVTFSTFIKICKDPTGTNFWLKWYNKNRKNMSHLLPQSKYWRKQRKYRPRKKNKI